MSRPNFLRNIKEMGILDSLAFGLASKLVFFPEKTIEFYPGQWNLNFEEVMFRSSDGLAIHGWFMPGGAPNRTLIYYHGNAGNMGDRLPKLRKLHGIGMNLFIFDYRGYGGSEGAPDLHGVVDDSLAAYRYVLSREDIDPNHIVLYGESLGGAMAIQVATQEKLSGLILESTFTSLLDMKRSAYPFFPDRIVPNEYRSLDLIRQVHEPILIMHGTQDRTIPFRMGEELFKAAPHPKRFVAFEGADHSDIIDREPAKYMQSIEEFLVTIGE